jgi:adapter protein MecA 1/2
MKIEKISENQIRCTLTREDLSSRNIQLTELAYGSEKAKLLFQDMMQEAHYEVGFDTGNSPLMIEAIPTSSESIILIITKVDDPEELDTRFSRFTQSSEDDSSKPKAHSGADEILDLFHKIYNAKKLAENESKAAQAAKKSVAEGETETSSGADTASPHHISPNGKNSVNLRQAYCFENLDNVIHAARALNGLYTGRNSLYRRDTEVPNYYLVLRQSSTSPENFNRVCNILSEYGRKETFTDASEAWLREHGRVLVGSNAVQKLEKL